MPYKNSDDRRAWLIANYHKVRSTWLRENGPCKRCGSWLDLEVDHVNPAEKVSHKVWTWSKIRRDTELAKCQVLCGMCHKVKTVETFRNIITHCPKGHEYTAKNTYLKYGRGRICRACGRDYIKLKRGVAQLG